jgi:5-hydroxyisourate hydrolase
MSKITTHVLDAVLGKPGAGIELRLEMWEGDAWKSLANSTTDSDGRCSNMAMEAKRGAYRLIFDTTPYFERHGRTSIYSEIVISFRCDGQSNYHLPLLLSDNSYTTYRGS